MHGCLRLQIYCTFHMIMHESHLRHHSVVAGGLVQPSSVRARKPAQGLFSDYLHSVGVGIRCPSGSVGLDTWVSLRFPEIDVRQGALNTYSMSCSSRDERSGSGRRGISQRWEIP